MDERNRVAHRLAGFFAEGDDSEIAAALAEWQAVSGSQSGLAATAKKSADAAEKEGGAERTSLHIGQGDYEAVKRLVAEARRLADTPAWDKEARVVTRAKKILGK